MPPAALIAGGLGLLGGVAGAQKDVKTDSTTSTNSYSSGVDLNPASNLQLNAGNGLTNDYASLQHLVDAGPGQSDVTAGVGASRDLASMLQQYSQQGGNLPTAQDMSSSQGIAANLFNPQRVAMSQAFQDQSVQASRQAALMGRSTNDPILAAKLATEQTRQSAQLNANQGAFAQDFALQQPGQRLSFANQRANVLGGLATQAMSNRQALAAMGQSILGQQQQYQIATSRHYGTNSGTSNSTQESGGGIKGAINGALGGIGAGMGVASSMMGMPGMGAGGGMSGGGASAMSSGGGAGGYFGGSNPYSSGSGASFGGFGGSNNRSSFGY